YTATGETFVNDILTKAGVENIAANATGWVYNVEDLVARDPNIIIIPAWADGMFQTTAPYSELTAVKEGNVIVLESTDTLDRQCARNADAVEMLAKLIFPECFEAEKAA
ncbi:MAG: ABC transporter substrate-binding protein, partial [Clostridiales bacterium]|nr:ABC transporter substrate-binding protein [Clostridiales bacterium]